MKVIVCGGRDYEDANKVYKCLDALNEKHGVKVIIEGGANGADRLAREWALSRSIQVCTMHANWDKLGRAAGPIRNKNMLDIMTPDCLVAFPGGAGTANMVKISKASGCKVWEVAP